MERNWILILLPALAVLAVIVVAFLTFLASRGSDSVKTPQVSLGCGTLILIAIIVSIFSQSGVRELNSDVSELRTTVDKMNATLQSQAAEISEIKTMLEQMQDAEQPEGQAIAP